jgi:hypothetical protein
LLNYAFSWISMIIIIIILTIGLSDTKNE